MTLRIYGHELIYQNGWKNFYPDEVISFFNSRVLFLSPALVFMHKALKMNNSKRGLLYYKFPIGHLSSCTVRPRRVVHPAFPQILRPSALKFGSGVR